MNREGKKKGARENGFTYMAQRDQQLELVDVFERCLRINNNETNNNNNKEERNIFFNQRGSLEPRGDNHY